MHKIKLALMACVLVGCQTTVERADEKAKKTSVTSTAYFKCGIAYGKRQSGLNEDPYYIAIAAKAACGREWLAAVDDIQATYNAEIWRRLTSSMDKTFIEITIASVISSRTS